MREIIEIPVEKVTPSERAVFSAQGIPSDAEVNERTSALTKDAIETFASLAQPRGVIMELLGEEFQAVYEGEGKNANPAPLEEICRDAEYFALFAVTVGQPACQRISQLFDSEDFAPASMLDATASEGTELLANAVEQHYRAYLTKNGRFGSSHGTLRFSPGYCGWHVSGQKKLFDLLRPEEIGITLSESFLMSPLKSISGVIISGDKSIFNFEDNYEFCLECRNRSCRERIATL